MGRERIKTLFCTVGATPQVVTETVWCLMHPERQHTLPGMFQPPRWKPDKIHIVTTAFKLDFIRKSLQTETGPLGRLIGGAPPVTIHVPRRNSEECYSVEPEQKGAAPDDLLRDVNGYDDAARMGNLILRILARLTSDPSADLHVSLAGGRKTMSAHALMALSLVGRSADKVSHVLVDPDYEDHPDFWHPDQGEMLMPKRGSARTEPLDPAQAKVILVPTPAPLMRNRVTKGEDLARLDLLDLMNKANLAAALENRPCVSLSVATNSISAYGVTIRLTPKHFAAYRLMATAREEGWKGTGAQGVGPQQAGWLTFEQIATANDALGRPIRDLMTEYISEAERVAGRDINDENSLTQRWKLTIAARDVRERTENIASNLNQDITRLRDVIGDVVGLDAAVILAPRRESKKRGDARFGLTIDPSNIEIC